MNTNFERMCRRTGAYSFPWLIRLYKPDESVELFFINDTQGRMYSGDTYVASTFDYIPNTEETGFDGGGSLSITVTDNTIIDMIEENASLRLEVVGVVLEGSTVTEVKSYAHQYGSVSWNGKTAKFTFDKDDRLDMTFPALVFSHYNNRGNA